MSSAVWTLTGKVQHFILFFIEIGTRRVKIIGATALAMYSPCVATFAVMVKELGVKDMLKSAGVMVSSAFVVGAAELPAVGRAGIAGA